MTVLWVPILPVSLNDWSRAHWSVRKREADRWRSAVAAVVARDRTEPVLGPVRVCMTFYWADRRRHDASNGAKLAMDSLVSVGLIRDDGPPWMVEECYRSRLAPSPDRCGVVVQIHQADAPAWPLPVGRKSRRPPVPTQGGAAGPPTGSVARQETLSAAGLRALAASARPQASMGRRRRR